MWVGSASEHHASCGLQCIASPQQHAAFELQTAVCWSIVLGHLLSMRVIEMTDGQAVCKLTLLEWLL